MKSKDNSYTGKFISRLREVIDPADEAWLVGGAVRDQLVGKPCHDLDILIPGDVRKAARRAANELDGKFFALDEDRGMYRILLAINGQTDVVDFSRFQGETLEADLGLRDFTINAVAVRLHEPYQCIDPLNGRQDIKDRILRTCSSTSLKNDPVRAIRAVRLSLAFNLHMEEGLVEQIKDIAPLLAQVSAERKRDEIFKILEGFHPASAIRLLDHTGLLVQLFPELSGQKGITQSPPHDLDVWEHTLATVAQMSNLLDLFLDPEEILADGGNLMLGLAAGKLGRFREAIKAHYQSNLNPFRSRRGINLLAALLHDVAKPETRTQGSDGRIHFYRHESIGADRVREIGQAMALSEIEINALSIMVESHLKPRLMSADDPLPSRRNIFRYFRSTGEFGVDTCLLSLADFLGKTNLMPDQEKWSAELDRTAKFLEGWYEQHNTWVQPDRLLNGNEIMKIFSLPAGKVIGEVLDHVQEAQAAGEISSREEALELAKVIIYNPRKEEDE